MSVKLEERRQQNYLEEAEPFFKMKQRILELMPKRLIISKEGIEFEPILSEREKETMEELDKHIQHCFDRNSI